MTSSGSSENAVFLPTDVIADDAEALATKLATDVARRLQSAIDARGRATLVVSGGSTPLPFLRALAGIELAWSQVVVTLADERWVDGEHSDSNEKFVHDHFLQGRAASARFVSLKTAATTPDEGWAEVEARFQSLPVPFDVVVLGMGGDGHTASLFPDTEGLDNALARGCGKLTWPMHPAVSTSPGNSPARMTMTLDALLNCEMLALHIVGNQKRDVFKESLTVLPTTYPIAAVTQAAREQLRVYWAP